MKRIVKTLCASVVLAGALALIGCSSGSGSKPNAEDNGAQKGNKQTTAAADDTDATEIAAERSKLSPEDRGMVGAQEWCVVLTDQRLGSMGPPIKLDVNGQSFFICCKGCRKKALADPATTLAKLEELKAKKKQQSDQR